MSKMRFRWLWVVVVLEVLAIAGLLIWGLVIREPAKAPEQQSTANQQQSKPAYNTPKVELVKVGGGFTQPTALVSIPDPADGRLFVVEQVGTVRTFKPNGSTGETPLIDAPFLDLRSKVQNSGEMGLLGLAFHPKFTENGYLFVNYVDKNRNTIIARYTATANGISQDSEKVLLKIPQPFANHNGGQLAFGPDGYLYIGMGDGGSSGDPSNRAQNKDDLLGKILRIDVDKGDPYGIPVDNPFAKGGGKPEIWAYGLRNPWRFSFDRQRGDLFIADVGQGTWEEINFQSKTSKGGENYGWRCFEGSHSFKNVECPEQTLAYPILEYDHSDGRCSVTGGYVYRGSAYPALAGSYFYGDYCDGQISSANFTNNAWQSSLATASTLKISTFGEDSAGELYVADHTTGTIYQITDTAN